ncbi:hypothetical protein [Streptomyces sp. NPDC048192]|jgi:hypothetical protein|uniref:hypothetical protein n=1 Tax=unclassified Streptomyces TaxID=2593676 RepID=UPI003716FE7B
MQLKTMAVGISALSVAALAFATSPAAASGTQSSGNTVTGRCSLYSGSQPFCLYYYNTGTGAKWGGEGSWSNLSGQTFFSGTGTGSGQAVKNNATAGESEYWENGGGTVWYNSGYSGNHDWIYDGQGGPLHYTYNEDAAVEVGIFK